MKENNGFFAKTIRLVFCRKKNTNDLTGYSNWRIGLSSAASWSWGVSLAVGIGIIFSKGLLPFMIWATGNVLALPLFGVVRKYFPLSKHGPSFIFPMILLFLFVEFFCIILNLQGLFNGFVGEIKTQGLTLKLFPHPFLDVRVATYVVMAIGFFVVWYIHKGGLKISVLTDMGQYIVQVVAVAFLAVFGIFLGEPNHVQWLVVSDSVNGLEWAKFGFFGIIVGALGTSHHWQRFSAIKEENILPSSLWAGFFFGIYMFFVGLAGYHFSSSNVLGAFFLLTMMALATSSIDSAVAGLEYVVCKLKLDKPNWIKPHIFASMIAIVAIALWPFFMKMGIVKIWSFMATYRLIGVVFFIIAVYFATVIVKIVEENSK